jgi:hypothetical protein
VVDFIRIMIYEISSDGFLDLIGGVKRSGYPGPQDPRRIQKETDTHMDTKINLASMTKDQFNAYLAQNRTTRGASTDAPKVGDQFTLCSDGRSLTVVRVEPGAKTCCYFQDAQGKIWYRNFTPSKGQTARVTKALTTKV